MLVLSFCLTPTTLQIRHINSNFTTLVFHTINTMDTLVEAVNATAKIPLHPYSPLNAVLPEYVTNTLSSRTLVGSFVLGSIAIFAVTLLFINSAPRKLSKGEIFVTLWFALCGCIHFFFEGECYIQDCFC
jgi:cholestenol delta-isomerase